MDIKPFLAYRDITIIDAIAKIDTNRHGVLVIVDKDAHVTGVLTDGDIRRAILAALDLNTKVSVLLERRSSGMYPKPITAKAGTSKQDIFLVMQEHKIRHLPLLDEQARVVDIAFLEDYAGFSTGRMTAVVMAGGFGKRLLPLTNDIPKPMLPVMGKPLMERQIEQLITSGINKVFVTTHYKSEKIVEHFGNGNSFGVDINYVMENQPLGTAGALSLLPEISEPVLVINGDILTRMDFQAFLVFHKEHDADMTVAVREFKSQVPYGVVEVNGVEIVDVVEKPTKRYFINAGIYLLNPDVLSLVPICKDQYDMPELINMLVKKGRKVVSFPVREYWLDIGHKDDYEKAQADVAEGRF
jgi:dTDP-glucose pyrophosphorylase/CBS domain-containing protein